MIEAASIRPSGNTKAEANLNSTPGWLSATNVTVGYLIRFAYGLQGLSDRARTGLGREHAVRHRRKERERTERKHRRREGRWCARLLADRFQRLHRETQAVRMRVYSLVVAQSMESKPLASCTMMEAGPGRGNRAVIWRPTRQTMDVFATVLSRELGTDVLNRTGLAGRYDFNWTGRRIPGGSVYTRRMQCGCLVLQPAVQQPIRFQAGGGERTGQNC